MLKHSPEIYPVRIPVPAVLSRLVQINNLVMSLANQVIFCDLTTSLMSADRRSNDQLTITPAMELRKTEYADR